MNLPLIFLVFGVAITYVNKPYGVEYTFGVGLIMCALVIQTLVMYSEHMRKRFRDNLKKKKTQTIKVNANTPPKPQRQPQPPQPINTEEELTPNDRMVRLKQNLIQNYSETVRSLINTLSVSKQAFDHTEIIKRIDKINSLIEVMTVHLDKLFDKFDEHYDHEFSDETLTMLVEKFKKTTEESSEEEK